ncbi:MAG: hypothetical protein COB36_13450 [Alphaproteobacteria bacterium]|nr:MAG: hypothetical protein COB36_13450 [Alphaproteobacteria bacterium]
MESKKIKLQTAALLSAWLFSILSLAFDFVSMGGFFSRSGSMLVLVAIIISYQLLASRNAYHNQQLNKQIAGNDVDFTQIHPSPYHQKLELFGQFTAVIGTVIWGYADLII